jgi:acetate---CoA ligase (ADP-forming)
MHESDARSRLALLLAPRSIAVIGGREAEEVARQCDRIGFSGDIWPVNPRRAEIAGRACFASIAELPRAPDAAFVAAPREASIAAVGELAARGTNGAVVYASGFSEAGAEGSALERKLVAASGDMALIGPNCYGALNYLDGVALWPDQHGGARVERGVALVLQSGNIAVNLTMQARGLPLAYVVAVGNKAKGDFADYVEAFLDDERVTAIGLHIEGLIDAEALDRAARRARELRKPIVAIKTGRSKAGAALTLSHTASLAGPDALYDAFFARLGVARAPDLSIFLETLKLLHVSGPLKGRRLSSMSCSGGEASLLADLAPAHGLTTPDLPGSAREALAAALGPKVAIGNPLDYHTYVWGEFEPTRAAFSAMLAAGYDMNALVLDFPRADRCDGSNWETTLAAFEAAQAATGAPAAVVASLPETMPEAIAQRLVAAGVVPFNGMSEALTAIRLASEVGEAWAKPASAQLQPVIRTATARQARMLDEAEAKAALARFGLAVPAFRVAPIAEAALAAEGLSFPVVVKALSAALAHKTNAGGVRLGLSDAAAVKQAAAGMAHLSERVLIEPMQEGALVELIVGVTRDALFGLALTFGAGGVFADLIDDHATVLLPASRAEIEAALHWLKIARLLDGYRGAARGDWPALVGSVEAIARYAEAHRDTLIELDVNPLLVFAAGSGAVAVDALIRLNEEVSK